MWFTLFLFSSYIDHKEEYPHYCQKLKNAQDTFITQRFIILNSNLAKKLTGICEYTKNIQTYIYNFVINFTTSYNISSFEQYQKIHNSTKPILEMRYQILGEIIWERTQVTGILSITF
jgi:hypothetical protein